MKDNNIIASVIDFLTMFMPETLAKRVVCIVLLAIGTQVEQVAQLTGFCSKTVKKVQNNLNKGNIQDLFKIGGGGRKSKTAGLEQAITDELNNNQYHSRQQIADMILEKHGIKLSARAVGELLKKTALNG